MSEISTRSSSTSMLLPACMSRPLPICMIYFSVILTHRVICSNYDWTNSNSGNIAGCDTDDCTCTFYANRDCSGTSKITSIDGVYDNCASNVSFPHFPIPAEVSCGRRTLINITNTVGQWIQERSLQNLLKVENYMP